MQIATNFAFNMIIQTDFMLELLWVLMNEILHNRSYFQSEFLM